MTKQNVYEKIEANADRIIDRLIELTDSKNPTVALGACRTLMDRIAPAVRGIGLLEVGTLELSQRNQAKKLLSDYSDTWGVKEEDIDKVIREKKSGQAD